ncbi:MAG: alpha/beta fold hydrolase [Propionibacteriaceae bacterium]|nr:alpha/beta fold hydrolase [Propionibacteriaceae bacterium]
MSPSTPPLRCRTRLDGLTLAWLEIPAGSQSATDLPVVLIHGLGMSARSFEPLLAALNDGPRALAIDLPGSGRSGSRGRLGVPEDLIRLLWKWIDARGVDRLVLVGHSLGAQVVTHLAACQPDRVASMVLIAPAPDPDAGGDAQTALRLLRGWLHERPKFMAYAIAYFLRSRPHRMWRVPRRAMAASDPDILRQVRAPALLVRGAHDWVSTAAGVRKLAEAFGDAHVEEVEGPHGLQFAVPDVIADAVRRAAREGAG